MPEDVPLGDGYIGSILAQRFPGQYRDAGDVAVQEFDTSGHYAQAPGAVQGHPRATDPVPGYAQPPSEAYGQPQHTPGGRVLTDPDVGRELQMKEIPGVGMVAMPPGEHEQFVGTVEGMDAVVPVDYPQAGEGSGWGVGAVVPVDHYLAGQGGQVGDWTGTPFGQMGTLTESIASLFSASDLDQLRRSMGKLEDSIVDAYNKLGDLEKDRLELAERTKKYPTFLPGISGFLIPTPIGIVNLETAAALKEGYTALTGFTYMIYAFRNSFGQAAPQISRVYSAITGTLNSMDLWLRTWQERVSQRKGMTGLFDQIQQRHNEIYFATTGAAMDFNNDAYLSTAMAAVEEKTGIKADVPAGSGTGILISTLIAIIAGAIALVAALVTILEIVSEFNAKANNLHEQRMAYEARIEEQRKDFAAKRGAEGASATEIEDEWNRIKTGEDKAQAKKEEDYAKQAPTLDIGEVLKKAILPVAIIGGVILVGTQVIPRLFPSAA